MDEELAWSREGHWAAHPLHVSEARAFVLDCLAETDLLAQAHAVALVVSELATNVVLHANTPFTVTLARRDSWLVLEVRDHLAGRVAVPAATGGTRDSELNGRGLEIVQAVSQAWGVWPRRDGKSVWAAFTLEPQDEDRGRDGDTENGPGGGVSTGDDRWGEDGPARGDGGGGNLPPWGHY